MENYKYEINLSTSFSIDQKVISKIYLPILGKDAIFLYQFLMNEYENNKYSLLENNNHNKLLESNNLKWNEFTDLRKKLEAIKLISTYINKETKTFTYVLNSPLSYEQFINNETMFTILRNRLTKKHLDEIEYNFSFFTQRANMLEISESIEYLLTETEKENYFIFDFEKLYKILISEFHTNFELSYDLKNKIDNLFSNRILNFNEIYQLVKNCVIETTNGYSISVSSFNEKVNDLKNEKEEANLSRKIIINRNFEIFSSNRELNEFNEIINDYKKYKSENYISSILKIDIDFEIKSWINLLREEYNFNDSMINTIIDYVIFKNNGLLHKNYILKIAKSILVKAINNVEGIINHFRNANIKKIKDNSTNLHQLKTKSIYNNLNDIEKKLIQSWK